MTSTEAASRSEPPGRVRDAHRWWGRGGGWPLTVAVTGLAAALRLPALDRLHELVFDETYYVKDAWTLLNLGYEAEWGEDPNPAFEAGDVDGYSTEADYVVHPAVGKWVIALGLRLLGAQDPVGWRLGTVVAGILTVLLLTRAARRLFGSNLLGAVSGTLLAIDGTAIVLSRTALLDGVLTLWVVAAFAALLLDRDLARRRLARSTAPPWATTRWGPRLGVRPWRLVAGVLLGLSIGTKWSGVWFLAVFGLLSVGWDLAARRRAGVLRPVTGTALRDVVPAFVSLVPVAALTYLATWASWFRSPGAYRRQWAALHPEEGVTWLPDALRSWWKYHTDMWQFHTHLTSEHSYASDPWTWIVQWKPTLFLYNAPEPAQQLCDADRCSQTVTSQGNPLLWWLAALAVLACLWWALRRRDGVAAAALSGVVAGWLPWFLYAERTIFAFYAVVFLPWTVLCLTHAASRWAAWAGRPPDHRGRRWRWRRHSRPPSDRWTRRAVVWTVIAVLGVLLIATSWFWYPLWTGEITTMRFWQLHQGIFTG